LIKAGSRDLRIDLFRGVVLWFIFINHIPGNPLRSATLAGLTLADSAEAFVLLAGYAAGLVYGRSADRDGWRTTARAIMGRAWTLYLAHLLTFGALAALAFAASLAFDLPDLPASMGLDPLVKMPLRAIGEALMLCYQPVNLDILPLYVVFLSVLALALPLLRRRPSLLLLLSLALYLFARVFEVNLPAWGHRPHWTLNPFAWQVVFVIGILLGYRQPGAKPVSIPLRWWLVLVCILFLVVGRAMQFVSTSGTLFEAIPGSAAAALEAVALSVFPIDKTGEHPLRLLSILAVAYLVCHAIPAGAAWTRSAPAAPLVIMGQNPLPVFYIGILLSLCGRIATLLLPSPRTAVVTSFVGLLLLMLVGIGAARRRAARSRAAPPAAPLGLGGG
jgi:hypothetical protein